MFANREVATCAVGAAATSNAISLLGTKGCKAPDSKALGVQIEQESDLNQAKGCKTPSDAGLSPAEVARSHRQIERTPPPDQLVLNIQGALRLLQAKQQERAEANHQQYRQEKRQRAQAEHVARLQIRLDSNDPVLVAEAERILGKISRVFETT